MCLAVGRRGSPRIVIIGCDVASGIIRQGRRVWVCYYDEGGWFRRPRNDPSGRVTHERTYLVKGQRLTWVCIAEDVCCPWVDLSRKVNICSVVSLF